MSGLCARSDVSRGRAGVTSYGPFNRPRNIPQQHLQNSCARDYELFQRWSNWAHFCPKSTLWRRGSACFTKTFGRDLYFCPPTLRSSQISICTRYLWLWVVQWPPRHCSSAQGDDVGANALLELAVEVFDRIMLPSMLPYLRGAESKKIATLNYNCMS